MPSATRILRERVVLIFDFDETLGPSTTEFFYEHIDEDYDSISKQLDEMQEDKWQYALAKAELLRRAGAEGKPVTKEKMEAAAKLYPPYPGVDDFMKRLRDRAAELDEDIDIEFVLLTAGFSTIPAATEIGQRFDRIYAGRLEFNDDGTVACARRIITHEDKVHYILQLVKGLDIDTPSQLEDTYTDVKDEEYYVPLEQVIYVGDGASDMSAFQTVAENGGIAIAINKPGTDWDGYDAMSSNRRVHNIADASYEEDSELYQCLRLAVERAIKQIQILRYGKGE